MTVISVDKDPATARLIVTAEFAAPIERTWELWADPRKLERWWGPPSYPATVLDHDLTPGGRVFYCMTGPEGDKHYGYWGVTGVDVPRRLTIDDGFADADGNPNTELPVTKMVVELAETDGRTRVVITSTFPSLEAMEQMIAMGMEEGLKEAMSQMDALVAA